MKKHKHLFKIVLMIVAVIFGILILALGLIYFWPHTNKELQSTAPQKLSYDQAVTMANSFIAAEPGLNVKPECQSVLMTHGVKTAKSVVMLHGITACPEQFKDLGKHFFDAGYNVYIPRVPYHGTRTHTDHSQITSKELVTYVNTSVDIAAALGSEAGVVGLSGGGMLATWATEYRPEISRILVLSPFYEPAASQAPKWQLPLLKFFYGYRILPDAYSEGNQKGFSYYALANYLILKDNLKKDPSGLSSLKQIGVITSPNDNNIDVKMAVDIPTKIAESNNLKPLIISLPAAWGVNHDIVGLKEKPVAEHQAKLYPMYLNAYEGRKSDL